MGSVTRLAILVTTAGLHYSQRPRINPMRQLPDELISCGNSISEAIARGCFMEPLLYGWVPELCYYKDLEYRKNALEDRSWYSDREMTDPISLTDLWAGNVKNVFTHNYHLDYCIFFGLSWLTPLSIGRRWLTRKSSISTTRHAVKRSWQIHRMKPRMQSTMFCWASTSAGRCHG